MLPDYQEYYAELLAAIESHHTLEGSEIGKIEASFKSSLNCWSRIQQLVKTHNFQSVTEEIFFFKEIKPRFTGLIEYYTQRYHALLFMPTHNAVELARFWKWELRKIERFYENNETFCMYIREGASDKDEEYFTREGKKAPSPQLGRIHDLDPATSSSHDYLVTMICAYKLYESFIKEEMKKGEGYFFLTR